MADISMDNVNIEIQSSSSKAADGVNQLINTLNSLDTTLTSVQNNVNQYTSSLGNMTNIAKGLKVPDIHINSNIPQVAKELEFLNSKTEIKTPEIKTPKVNTDNIKKASKDVDNYKGKINSLSNIADKTKGRITSMFSSINKARLTGLGNGISNIGKSIASAGKKMLRLTTALFGIRSAFYAVRNISNEFLSSQNATAQQLSANISYLKYALGSMLAPVIEFITNLIYNLLKAIQSIVYFFAKINIFAKGSAKSFASSAGSAGKTTKELQKQLQAFDELNNINLENKSGSGGGGGGGITPSFDLGDVEPLAPKFADMLLNGDWYEIGYQVGQKITEALEKIPWDKIKTIAGKIGENLALFINGAIDGTNWNLVGKTFAEGLNTVIEFGYNFLKNFNGYNFGKAISDTINGFFEYTEWNKLGETISLGVSKTLDSISGFLENLNWNAIVDAIVKFIEGLDFGKVATSLFKALVASITSMKNLKKAIEDAVKEKVQEAMQAVSDFFTQKTEEAGGDVIEGLKKGILDALVGIGEWIVIHTVQPMINGFCSALGIHSPSTVFMGFGNDIIQGLLNGMKQLVGNVSKIAQDVWKGFTGAIQNIANWINTTIIQPATNFFNNLGNSIIQTGKNIWNGFTNAISNISNWIKTTIIQPSINFFNNLGSSVINIGRNIYNGFTNAISNISNWVNSRIIQPVINAFNGLWNSISNIFNNIKNTISNTLSNVNVKIKLPHFSWSSKPASGWMASTLSALGLPTNLPKLNIDWYAQGGYPTEGDLFFANEAGPEMIGSIGNKTAVANNDQIAKAIAEAAYQAVSKALYENQDSSQPIIVNVGNETLYKGMTKSRSQASNQYGITV